MEGSLVELYEEVLARGTYENIGRDTEGWGWIPQPQSEISDLECALLVEVIHGLATDAGRFLEKREMQELGDSLSIHKCEVYVQQRVGRIGFC